MLKGFKVYLFDYSFSNMYFVHNLQPFGNVPVIKDGDYTLYG